MAILNKGGKVINLEKLLLNNFSYLLLKKDYLWTIKNPFKPNKLNVINFIMIKVYLSLIEFGLSNLDVANTYNLTRHHWDLN